MASNWRFGVWAHGLSFSEVLLIARLNTDPTGSTYVCKIRGSFFGGIYQVFSGTNVPTYVQPVLVPPPFPYGLDVEPD